MTEPKTYRKKPVQVQAMQWDGRAMGATQVIDWILTNHGSANYECDTIPCGSMASDDGHHIKIQTLEGPMRAGKHWWIIRGVDGEFYPIRDDIFAKTYEVVE
jgi:hypothetical protein